MGAYIEYLLMKIWREGIGTSAGNDIMKWAALSFWTLGQVTELGDGHDLSVTWPLGIPLGSPCSKISPFRIRIAQPYSHENLVNSTQSGIN